MKKGIVFLSLFFFFVLAVFSCKNEDVDSRPEQYSLNDLSDPERINKFIVDVVEEIYLWKSETDWSKYNTLQTFKDYTDHDKLFEELIYRKDDKWSNLTDDIAGLENQFAGISTTFGYTLSFYLLPDKTIIAVVLFTSPGSPAEKAGLKRGDIIVEMNGAAMTEKNYVELYYAPSLVIRCGVLDLQTDIIEPLPETKSITAVNMYENPIVAYKIIEKGGRKIGYLCYTGYQIESEKELERIFTRFKSEGVTEVVLDLRYNPGGYSRTAQILSSILVPESAVKNKSVYLEHLYNDLYSAYYRGRGEDLKEYFVDTLSVNMNLARLYVLTSGITASASEATIVGLKPYLDLVQIGGTTSGKYCGGVLLSPADLYENRNYYTNFSNWGMYIMIYRFFNSTGISSFTSGLAPAIKVEEDEFDLKPFGDEEDPLLGSALAHMFNKTYVGTRSGKISLPVTQLPDIKRPVDGLMIYSPSSLPVFNKK